MVGSVLVDGKIEVAERVILDSPKQSEFVQTRTINPCAWINDSLFLPVEQNMLKPELQKKSP